MCRNKKTLNQEDFKICVVMLVRAMISVKAKPSCGMIVVRNANTLHHVWIYQKKKENAPNQTSPKKDLRNNEMIQKYRIGKKYKREKFALSRTGGINVL